MSELKPEHPEFFHDPEEGTVTLVGEMPECIPVRRRLLLEREGLSAGFIWRKGDHVTIRCDNGTWRFRIAEWRERTGDGEGAIAICVLES